MSFARTLTVAVAVLAVSVSAYDYKSYNTRSCTASNARCAGAPGKPYVKYAPCCDGAMSCKPMPDASAEQWGRYCVAPSAPVGSGPQCYNSGERCMGAPGKPYVEYMPCCAAGESCSAKDGDWGGFCQSAGAPAPVAPISPPVCYSTGERCMGETGYPYVPFMECCNAGESCVKSSTTWGSVCTAASTGYYGKGWTTPPPTTTTTTPTVPSPPRGYYGKGKERVSPIADILKQFPELGPGFCSANAGADPAIDNIQPPFVPTDDQAVIEITFPLRGCSGTLLSFSDADAQAFCAAMLSRVLGTDPTAECRYVSVAELGPGDRQLVEDGELELDVSERQGLGILLIIQIICGSSLYTLILVICGPIVIFLGGFITPLPIVTPGQ